MWTVELAVMGVLREYHRGGIGKSLFEAAKAIAQQEGYLFHAGQNRPHGGLRGL